MRSKSSSQFGAYVGHDRKKRQLDHDAQPRPCGARFARTPVSGDHYVSRVELSLPIKATFKRQLVRKTVGERWADGKYAPGALLIGLLDDGCPFAAAQFLGSQAGAGSTRVRAIWDQDTGKQPIPVIGAQAATPVRGDTVGLQLWPQFRRDFAVPSRTNGIGPNGSGRHLMPTGSIDEDGCYADAGFTNLALRKLHGAHVMDVLAGRIRPRHASVRCARPGPPRSAELQPGTDPAATSTLGVRAIRPEHCIRDATGVWLKTFVRDADPVHPVICRPDNYQERHDQPQLRPDTGPHDGMADLEEALTALVTEYDGINKKPKLEIVVPAGNAYLSDGHVLHARHANKPDHVEWTWRLPPDNAALCFAEVWMNKADAHHAVVTLTTPDGLHTYVPTPPPSAPSPYQQAGVDLPLVRGHNKMWRLQVEPTIAAPDMAEHGDWKIKVTGIGNGAHVHAYVARSDRTWGSSPGPTFVFRRPLGGDHSAAASCTYADGEFDRSGSLIHRDGTLNGIATDLLPSVHVAGGFIIANGRKSPYSSAGPARGGPAVGPDYLLCESSYALKGIRAGGNRSGAVFRLVGTRSRHPSWHDRLSNWYRHCRFQPQRTFQHRPREIAKRGGGNIEPP